VNKPQKAILCSPGRKQLTRLKLASEGGGIGSDVKMEETKGKVPGTPKLKG
jgi:hypothetical protein